MRFQLRGVETREEIAEGFRVEGTLPFAVVEAFMDLAEVEAQPAQNVGGLEQDGADLSETIQAEQGFVQEGIAEELGTDGAPCTAIRELLEEPQDFAVGEELCELVHELAGSGDQTVAVAAPQGTQDCVAIFGDKAPVGPYFAGRHKTPLPPTVYHKARDVSSLPYAQTWRRRSGREPGIAW